MAEDVYQRDLITIHPDERLRNLSIQKGERR